MLDTTPPVRRRHVFFFSGFDPKGAAYYHRIYRQQAARQTQVSGLGYQVGNRHKVANGNTCWSVRCEAGDGQGAVQTTYEYVRWDDIVREQWPRSALGVFKASLRTYLAAVVPALRLWRIAPKQVASLFYPALYWLLAVALALFLGVGVAGLVARVGGAGWWPQVVGLLAGALLMRGAGWLERRVHTTWLLRIFAFAHAWATERVPGLPQRLDAGAQALRQRLDDPALDEVLVVGFSVGGMLAVSVVARALAAAPSVSEPAPVSMLTLGHCVPLLGLMPDAHSFRTELQQVGGSTSVCWVDVSAPGDWGSLALIDPVRLCAPAPTNAGTPARTAVNPRRLASPRFHTLFEPETYRALRKDKRRMHMQYLMAGERAGVYDYFALTAGPLGLRQRLNEGRVS